MTRSRLLPTKPRKWTEEAIVEELHRISDGTHFPTYADMEKRSTAGLLPYINHKGCLFWSEQTGLKLRRKGRKSPKWTEKSAMETLLKVSDGTFPGAKILQQTGLKTLHLFILDNGGIPAWSQKTGIPLSPEQEIYYKSRGLI